MFAFSLMRTNLQARISLHMIASTAPRPFSLSNEPAPVNPTPFPQVIRRDLQGDDSGKERVVPWLGHKVAKAVASACVLHGNGEEIGRQVQTLIEARLQAERPSFIHIEQLQDLVEETLIDIGQARVALAYGKYRVQHSAARSQGIPIVDDSKQMELATPEQLVDIRSRISFAKIGVRIPACREGSAGSDHEAARLPDEMDEQKRRDRAENGEWG